MSVFLFSILYTKAKDNEIFQAQNVNFYIFKLFNSKHLIIIDLI